MLALSLSLLLAAPAPPGPAAYAKPGLLIEPKELLQAEANKFVLLDARGPKAGPGVVVGSYPVDAEEWAREFKDGSDPAAWAKRLGQYRLALDGTIVVFDDALSRNAARVWWILRYWGFKDVRLVNGGWAGLKPLDFRKRQFEEPTAAAPLKLDPQADRLATKADVLAELKAAKCQVVDARAEDEYRGTDTTMPNKRKGAMPGAKHLHYADLLDATTQRFLPPKELAAKFAAAGIDPKKPVVTHCQGGARSSTMAFALELMGGDAVRNYHASFGEWGNADDTPIVTPKPAP